MIRPLRDAVEEFVKEYIANAIMETRSISKAALYLQIHRNTIHRILPGRKTTGYLRRQRKIKFDARM